MIQLLDIASKNWFPGLPSNSTICLDYLKFNELSDIIDALDDTKFSRPCSIPTKFLKMAKEDISATFSEIGNSSFEEGFFSRKE